MSNIDKLIQEHLEDEEGPIGSICITGESGSFELKKGVRLVLRESNDVECTGAEERNELTLYKCSDAKVKDFKGGVLRAEKCDSLGEITCSEKSTVNIGDTEVEKLELTQSNALLMGCKIQEGTFEKTKIESVKNEYEGKVEITGGTLQSHEDKFKDECSLTEKSTSVCEKPEFEKEFTLDQSKLVAHKAKFKDQVTITQGILVDNEGEFEDKCEVTENSQFLGRKSQFKDDFTAEGSVFNGIETKIDGKFDFTAGNCSGTDFEVKDKATFSQSQVILTGASFQDDTEVEKSSVRLVDCEFQGKFEVTGGAIDSEKSSFQDKFTLDQGTLTSVKDEFVDDVECSDLVYKNLIYKPQSGQNVTMSGKEGQATLEIFGWEAQEATFEKFTRLILNDCQFQKLEITGCQHIEINKGQSEETTIDTCGTVELNDTTAQKLDATDCGQVFAGDSEVQEGTFENIGLLVTNAVSDMTVSNCTVNDTGSTIDAEDSIITCIGGQVTGSGVMLTIINGQYEVSGNSVVNAVGSSGINEDGLTSGTGFEADEQAGALLVEEMDVKLQASIGNLTAKSLLLDVYVEAPEGNIIETAGLSLDMIAGLAITGTSGEEIDLFAGTDALIGATASISCASGSDFLVAAGAAIDMNAGANAQLLSAGNTVIIGSSAEVIADAISIIGQVEFV